jgi:hypothetical protein
MLLRRDRATTHHPPKAIEIPIILSRCMTGSGFILKIEDTMIGFCLLIKDNRRSSRAGLKEIYGFLSVIHLLEPIESRDLMRG